MIKSTDLIKPTDLSNTLVRTEFNNFLEADATDTAIGEAEEAGLQCIADAAAARTAPAPAAAAARAAPTPAPTAAPVPAVLAVPVAAVPAAAIPPEIPEGTPDPRNMEDLAEMYRAFVVEWSKAKPIVRRGQEQIHHSNPSVVSPKKTKL
jgi:hypothetical protein